MSKIIIGIHGLGNKPDPERLKKWWLASIREGLGNLGKSELDLTFELAYWAHLLHPIPLNPAVDDKDDPLYVEDPYIPADKNNKIDPPGNLRKKIVDYLGDQLEEMFLNDDLTINFSSVSDFIIKRFFSDLAVYYNTFHDDQQSSRQQRKKEIRTVLKELLLKHRKKEILLIAHSMGAIIAYDVLTELGEEIRINTLITIGCPLGLPIIRGKIAAEHSSTDNPKERLKTPEAVTANWFNLADLKDKIALYHRLGDDFIENSKGVRVIDKTVINTYSQINGDRNPHKAYGYLRTPELIQIVSTFLEARPPGFFPKILEKLRGWFG
ncbi:GPI inositol-deacylase [bacterium]|nr:GPI inositol-deacylase [bacterium]